MLHRLQYGRVPDKPHTAFYHKDKIVYEHCFTRQGFSGTYSILYHPNPPHVIQYQEDMGLHPGVSPTEARSRPLRRHFLCGEVRNGGSPFLGREMLMRNADLAIWYSLADQADPALSCNADGDEMVYIYDGEGELQTPYGVLPYKREDYVYIPRSMVHRWKPSRPTYMLIMEGRSWIDVPLDFRHETGQLKMDAPYSHRDFRTPTWHEGEPQWSQEQPFEVILKREDHLTRQHFAHHPFDVIGWDGQLWPYAFPIRCFQPKTGLVHLPPTIHTTFVGGGFVICSFVPRMVDFHPRAVPCPYPHSSVDCDEMLFYVEGNFTSRKGVGPTSISLHPMGLPHGPHPGTYEASIGSRESSELAVMVDTYKPLLPTERAQAIEDGNYQMSWIES